MADAGSEIDKRDLTDDLANAHSCKLSERQIGDCEFSLQNKYQRVGLLAFVDHDIAVAEPFENSRLRDPLNVGVGKQSKDVEDLSHQNPSFGLQYTRPAPVMLVTEIQNPGHAFRRVLKAC